MKKEVIAVVFFLFLMVFMPYFINGATDSNDCPEGYTFESNGLAITSSLDGIGISHISGECVPIIKETTSSVTIPEKLTAKEDCNRLGFCWHDNQCYGFGVRVTIKPEYKNKPLSWLNETFFYCEGGSKKLVTQKITEKFCENDFECQSNKCLNNKCVQKQGIQINEISNNEIVKINLFFREKELFYFSGLNKDYSIGFGKNESDFVFLINNETYIFGNKTFNLDNYSQIVVESIFFENDFPNANITLIESKNPLNKNLNNSEEIEKGESLNQITGNVIEESNNIKNKEKPRFIQRITDFFKNIFTI